MFKSEGIINEEMIGKVLVINHVVMEITELCDHDIQGKTFLTPSSLEISIDSEELLKETFFLYDMEEAYQVFAKHFDTVEK